jgi:RNA polymerase sigma-70 factor, ECF subfamily
VVYQQVFVSAWRSRASFDPARGTLGGWLVTITRNKVADALRERQRDSRVMLRAAGSATVQAPEAPPDQVIDRIVLTDELAQLPEPQRLVMLLAFYSDLTHEQIAQVLGMRSWRRRRRRRYGTGSPPQSPTANRWLPALRRNRWLPALRRNRWLPALRPNRWPPAHRWYRPRRTGLGPAAPCGAGGWSRR